MANALIEAEDADAHKNEAAIHRWQDNLAVKATEAINDFEIAASKDRLGDRCLGPDHPLTMIWHTSFPVSLPYNPVPPYLCQEFQMKVVHGQVVFELSIHKHIGIPVVAVTRLPVLGQFERIVSPCVYACDRLSCYGDDN